MTEGDDCDDHEDEATKKRGSYAAPVQLQTRPATVREMEENIRVEATSLPGRRVIGDRVYCGTVEDLRPDDLIGRDQPYVVQDSRIPTEKKGARFSAIMERAAHYRELFLRTGMYKKTYVLAKNTKADEEVVRNIPDCVYVGVLRGNRFGKLPLVDSTANVHGFVAIFLHKNQRSLRAHFRRGN